MHQRPNGDVFPSLAAEEPPNRPFAEPPEVQKTADDGPNQATDDFPMQDADETADIGPELPPELPLSLIHI